MNSTRPITRHTLQVLDARPPQPWPASEALLGDVATIQQTLLQRMREGATFSTAHKEGGAVIRATGRGWEHVEYGDSPSRRAFASDSEFLAFLRRFFDYECSRHVWPARVPEADAWRLILRRLEPPREHGATGGDTGLPGFCGVSARATTIAAVAAVLALSAGLAYFKFSPKAAALRAAPAGPTLERVQALPAAPEKKDWQRLQGEQKRAVEAAKATAR